MQKESIKFRERYSALKETIDIKLNSLIKKENPKTLYEPVRYILSGGGKRIRPMILILSCEASGGNAEDALNAAGAVEILHNFTLVHDDIMDNAGTRRGRETIHKKWDVNTAILAGDNLIGIAYEELLKTSSGRIAEIAGVFTNGITEVCEGQSYDKEFEKRNDVTSAEYLMMIGKKTAKLVETSARIGSIIGGADEEVTENLCRYAFNTGMAFQIQDDLLDITGNEEEFGKKIGGDIIEGKKTYLLLKALETVREPERRKHIESILESNGNNGTGSETDVMIMISEVKKIYEESGTIEFCRQEVERYTNEADSSLEKIKDSEAKEMLRWFSGMLLGRSY
jgi:geranylgeranyl diphosphate synthase type II